MTWGAETSPRPHDARFAAIREESNRARPTESDRLSVCTGCAFLHPHRRFRTLDRRVTRESCLTWHVGQSRGWIRGSAGTAPCHARDPDRGSGSDGRVRRDARSPSTRRARGARVTPTLASFDPSRFVMSAFAPAVSTVTAARGSAFSGARVTSRSAAMPAKPLRRAVLTRAGPGETLIQVEKPLGVNLKASNKGISGGVEVASARGNAAKAGLKQGDYIVYCSSFFGDELWPADQLGSSDPPSRRAPTRSTSSSCATLRSPPTSTSSASPSAPRPRASARSSPPRRGARHPHLASTAATCTPSPPLRRTGQGVRLPPVQRPALALRQVRRRDGQGHRRFQGAPHHHRRHHPRPRRHRVLPHPAPLK